MRDVATIAAVGACLSLSMDWSSPVNTVTSLVGLFAFMVMCTSDN